MVGSSSASVAALKNLRELIAQESSTVFQLDVIDVKKYPQLAEHDRILAVPTLSKEAASAVKKDHW